jgi:magnesium transporter
MAFHAYLYDAGGHDREIAPDRETLSSLDAKSLLWIDVEAPVDGELQDIAELLNVPVECLYQRHETSDAKLENHGEYFRFSVAAAPQHVAEQDSENGGAGETIGSVMIHFLVGGAWLVTVHDGPVQCLRSFRDQAKAETMIGLLSPQALAASLLDWHLGAFFDEVSRIEAAVDRLDERVLREATSKHLLGRMVAMRRRVSQLRNLLVRQRDVFYGLSRPDFALITEAGATSFYAGLANRFERALDEVERARDLVTGSFELFTSRSSQQVNDLVKALTFLTAIIGFCAAVAGLLGMNFQLSIFDTGYRGFLFVTGALVLISVISVIYARRKNWI